MFAICKIRREPHYRREAFEAGLRAAGYGLYESGAPKSLDDLLVIWNRQGADEMQADDWERRGGTVVVCENGYFGRDENGLQLYAIALHGHNGSGWFHVGDDDRFDRLGIELAPWRIGERILICGQRGIGSAKMASPRRWEGESERRLRAMGYRDIKVRQHPGHPARRNKAGPLDDDLFGAGLCLIWSSSSGLRALQLGIPVTYCAPHWIGSDCASRGLAGVDKRIADDEARRRAMCRAAWGQWTLAEITSGVPFTMLREHRPSN